MKKEETFQKLTQLFASKINYDGEFNSLFILENEKHNDKLKINFLNKQHYYFILKHFINDILEVMGDSVVFGYLSLKTNPITLKSPLRDTPLRVVKPAPVKPKEKVELPTIRNRTINEIKQFMYNEYDKIKEENLKLIDEYREKNRNHYESVRWADNWGQIDFMGKLNEFLNKIKDYDED